MSTLFDHKFFDKYAIDKQRGQGNVMDASEKVLIENHIDCYAELTWTWTCPKCERHNFMLLEDKETGAIKCNGCQELYEHERFFKDKFSAVKMVLESPNIIPAGGLPTEKRGRGQNIDAHPLIKYSWTCPACNKSVPTIPDHRDGLCKCPHCDMRFYHDSMKFHFNKYVERLISEVGVPVHNL